MFLLRVKPNLLQKAYQNGIRNLWGYVAIAFNKVDEARLKLVGPDRLCAEWVLKNGGAVAFSILPDRYLRDYNSLPPENNKLKIVGIDASNSSIMKIGFDHLIDCKHIEKITLHNCKHLEHDGLQGLLNVKDTLKYLQLSGCYNITDDSVIPLRSLTTLQTLRIFDLIYVKNLSMVIKDLQTYLSNCQIISQ